jgi:Flp pilus assembly protein TadD
VTALGLLLAQRGELEEAARLLAEAIILAPRKAAPYKFLGMVNVRRGEAHAAVANLTAALALDSCDPLILSELGLAFLQQGKHRRAIEYLTKALKINPQDNESRYYLEVAKKQLGTNGKKIVDTP